MKSKISYLIIIIFISGILIFTGCRQRGPRIIELPGGGGKWELKKGQYLDSILCEHILLRDKNDSILARYPIWDRNYTGDSLFMFLEECKGIPKEVAKRYDVRFHIFQKGTTASGTMVVESYTFATGSMFSFELPRERGGTHDIGYYTNCPICEFDEEDISPQEANSFRREYDWREIVYFKKNNVASDIANKYERPLRAYTICILANDRPDIPPVFANECAYEKADNIIKIFDAGIPLEYANIAKTLVERYVERGDTTTYVYTIFDLIDDYNNNVSAEELEAKVKAEVKPCRYDWMKHH